MQFVRTFVWALLLVALLLFSINNWIDVTVRLWADLIWTTKLPALVIISFLLGLLPMWLLHRAGKWRMNRRINALETAARNTASLSSTQLEAVEHETPAN
jgi:hypothetical protein